MAYDDSKDPHANAAPTRETFGTKARAITPSDTVDLNPYPKAVVVSAAGNLVVLPLQNADGSTVTFTGVSPGFVVPFRVRRVMSTSTTASAIAVDG